jgi:hypothetical protein
MEENRNGERTTEKKIPGGKYIKLSISITDGSIAGVSISGDFFVYPERYIEELEDKLVGLLAVPDVVLAKLDEHKNNFKETVEFIGLNHDDIAQLIIESLSNSGQIKNYH